MPLLDIEGSKKSGGFTLKSTILIMYFLGKLFVSPPQAKFFIKGVLIVQNQAIRIIFCAVIGNLFVGGCQVHSRGGGVLILLTEFSIHHRLESCVSLLN